MIKTYAFIDATNIIYGASDSGWKVDFEKLMRYLKSRFEAIKIFYFAGLDQENLKQLKFYEKMQSFGFELRLVPVKTFKDGRKKADVDSRMTFEMMRMYSEYDRVVTFTGDGDFYWVLEHLIQSGKIVKLFGHQKSTAKELKKLFKGDYIPLANIRHEIEREIKNEADTTDVSAS